MIKIILEDGNIGILFTSLLDPIKYKIAGFGEFYHFKWNHEESYKLMKNKYEINNFSGKKEIAVEQDFHAKILF